MGENEGAFSEGFGGAEARGGWIRGDASARVDCASGRVALSVLEAGRCGELGVAFCVEPVAGLACDGGAGSDGLEAGGGGGWRNWRGGLAVGIAGGGGDGGDAGVADCAV